MWKCPSCDAPLKQQQQHSLRCDNGHNMDIAKEGYVNLLLANQKHSKEPGDNKQMINARRAFLERGFYLPLAETIADLIAQHRTNPEQHLFDAGCGEGYYLHTISERLSKEHGAHTTGTGCDIAKVAIQKAAKKYKEHQFAVASTFHLPLLDESQDAIIQVFAPSSTAEILRVLKQDGIWIQVNPAPNHLHQLKSLVYDSVQHHDSKHKVYEGFSLLEEKEIQFDFELTNPQDTLHLLMMTPFYWSASEVKQQKVEQELKQVSAHFHIQVLQKNRKKSPEIA